MTVRNLDAAFRPQSIVVVGAGTRQGSVGAVLARNLAQAGFRGSIRAVHPRETSIEGLEAFPSIEALPDVPDLAVIATPPESVPELIRQLGDRGTRAAIVITAGFGEGGGDGGGDGHRLRQAVLDAAKPHLLRVVGPNCLGVLVPGSGLDASFAHIRPQRGGVAFVAQSGAMVTSILDWAVPRGIGFSHLVSLGDMIDVDFGDMLDWLATDRETTAILLYIEAITHSRKFMSAARAAARVKPVIAIKAGRFAEGARAASSHTGALAGVDAVYDAAFARAGILRVRSIEELFGAVETLARVRDIAGSRLGILTNGGGMGVMATDALIGAGGTLATLGAETIERLDTVLPPTWSRANPVDIIGDATGERYAAALDILLDDPGLDALLVLNCPTAVASSGDAAQAVVDTLAARKEGRGRRPVVLTSWVGEHAAAAGRRLFIRSDVPTFATPEDAVRAFMHLARRRQRRELLMETPPSLPESFVPDRGAVRAELERALVDGRDWLTEPEAKRVLAAYGIPVVATETAATPAEARAAAARIGGAVALKILSPDITHKTDVQGVALDLETPAEVEAAAQRMLERVAAVRPDARIEGFTVQAMIRRAAAHEVILGMIEDPQFGPVILFGRGGTMVEIANDRALALPPLNMKLAREQIAATRMARWLGGYRGRPPADIDAIAFCLVKLSQLAADFAEIVEIDVNPLLADDQGVIAVDARMRVRATAADPSARLAIRPYPTELEQHVALPNGRTFLLRPVRAEDEPSFHEMFRRLDPQDIRMRFFAPKGQLTHEAAARLTQIDYDREMALVAVETGSDGQDAVFGVVRIISDPDNARAEYAILVDSAIKGDGLGRLMMLRIIAYARARGIREIWGAVLRENRRMLALCDELGFRRQPHPEETSALRVVLAL